MIFSVIIVFESTKAMDTFLDTAEKIGVLGVSRNSMIVKGQCALNVIENLRRPATQKKFKITEWEAKEIKQEEDNETD